MSQARGLRPAAARAGLGVVLAGAVAAVTAGAAACGGGSASTTTGHATQTITLYNGQHVETTDAVVSAFESQTGIKVKVRTGDEDQLAEQIEQEGSSSPADVIYTENSPALMDLEEKNLLAPVPASTLDQVPAKYDSPAGDWLGVSARVSVLVYNTSRLTQAALPSSVLDLAEPQWKGKLAIAPTETDFQPIVTAVAQAEGRSAALAWLDAVKANGASHTYPDNETITADVNSGQAEIGIINQYYWYRLQKELGPSAMHSAIAYLAPGDPGYVVDVSGAAVLASSKHQAAADELLAFLVSVQGQQVMAASDSFEYPLRPGVNAPAGLTLLAQLHPYPITIAELGDGSVALQLLQQAQLL